MEPKLENDDEKEEDQPSKSTDERPSEKNAEQAVATDSEQMSLADVDSAKLEKMPLPTPVDGSDNGGGDDSYDEKQPILA